MPIFILIFIMIVVGTSTILLFCDWMNNRLDGRWPVLFTIIWFAFLSWLVFSLTQSKEYNKEPDGYGQVVNSFNKDGSIIATIVYEEKGVVKIQKLDGFIPAGVKVRIFNAKLWYRGILYELSPKIEFQTEPETQEGIL